jgi:hypothetical protein
MSTETLKFFEAKSTESIINWMMNHLTEEQIRMCLDQSTIPDSSLVATSSTTPLEARPSTAPAVSAPLAQAPKKSASELFTDKYRKKCYGTQYLIKQVTKEGVEYYEFKEVDEEDAFPSLLFL